MEVPDDGENQHISGHAMMATAPLYTDIIERPGSRYPCQMPQLKRKDLINLLNLSAALEISEPEIPPVRAWIKLMQDSRTRGFGAHDFEVLKASLLHKIHCYRYAGRATNENKTLTPIPDSALLSTNTTLTMRSRRSVRSRKQPL